MKVVSQEFDSGLFRLLQKLLPASILSPLDEAFDFLGTSSGGDKECIWHIHDHQIIDSKTGDKPSRSGNHNASSNLFSEHCQNTTISMATFTTSDLTHQDGGLQEYVAG